MSFFASIGASPMSLPLTSEQVMIIDRLRGDQDRLAWFQALLADLDEKDRARTQTLLNGEKSVLRPPEPKDEYVCALSISAENTLSISTGGYCERFVSFAKGKRYRWNKSSRTWTRKYESYHRVEDRLVEMACLLLLDGFIVSVPQQDLRERIVDSQYELEHTRWVTTSKHGFFVIRWGDREDFSRNIRMIPYSKMLSSAAVVHASSYEQVIDFAEVHDFRLSDEARQLAAATEHERVSAWNVEVKPRLESRKAPKPVSETVVIPDELLDA